MPSATSTTKRFSDAVIALAAVTLLVPFDAVAEPAGTFEPAGNMSAGRMFPRATLLADGRVLITGYGPVVPGPLGADVYDAATRTFKRIETPTIWARHSSTLLPDGTVLIAGGYAAGVGSARAYLFFPDDRSFVPVADMTRPRVGHTATLLNNGKVLLAGGETLRPPNLPDITAELYDPQNRSFTATGTFVDGGPLVASSTLLADGKVLVAGYYSGRAAVYAPASARACSTRSRRRCRRSKMTRSSFRYSRTRSRKAQSRV